MAVALKKFEPLRTIEGCNAGADPSKTVTGSHRLEDLVGGRAADAIGVDLLIVVDDVERLADGVASGSCAVDRQAVVAADELEQALSLALRSDVVAAVCVDGCGVAVPDSLDG